MRFFPGLLLVITAVILLMVGIIFTTDYFIEKAPTSVVPIIEVTLTKTEVIIYGIASLVLAVFCFALLFGHPWPWVRRRPCMDCHATKTRNRDELGFPVCNECSDKRHVRELISKAEEKAAGQPQMRCPVDGTPMEKLILKETEIVIDHCPQCKGAWLEADEITELEEDLGQPSGGGSFSSGMILGQALGNMAAMSR